MPTTPRPGMSATPRGLPGARSRPLSSAGARHLLRPEVGVTAATAALGSFRPAWQGGRSPRAASHLAPPSKARVDDVTKPYHVGKSRAKEQLKIAMSTHDKETQLRRLEQALETNRYTRSRNVGTAQEQVRLLSRVVADNKRPATVPAASIKAMQTNPDEDFRPATAPAPSGGADAASADGADDEARQPAALGRTKTEALQPENDNDASLKADEGFGEGELVDEEGFGEEGQHNAAASDDEGFGEE